MSLPSSACCLATFLVTLPLPAAQVNWCRSPGQVCLEETSGEEEVEVNCEGCYRQDNIKISKARAALLSNSSLLPQAEIIRGRARGQARLNACSQRQLKLLKDNIEVVSPQLSGQPQNSIQTLKTASRVMDLSYFLRDILDVTSFEALKFGCCTNTLSKCLSVLLEIMGTYLFFILRHRVKTFFGDHTIL